MSDTTFRTSLIATAPAAQASARRSIGAVLRAGVDRGRHLLALAGEVIETYAVVEGVCLVSALSFTSSLLAAACSALF